MFYILSRTNSAISTIFNHASSANAFKMERSPIGIELFVILRVNPLFHRYSFWRIKNRQLLKNIAGKGEIARNEQFLLVPQCFLLYQISVSPFVHIFDLMSLLLNCKSKIGISGKGLTLSLMMTTQEAFMNNVDQDQTAQNIQSYLWSTLSEFPF